MKWRKMKLRALTAAFIVSIVIIDAAVLQFEEVRDWIPCPPRDLCDALRREKANCGF